MCGSTAANPTSAGSSFFSAYSFEDNPRKIRANFFMSGNFVSTERIGSKSPLMVMHAAGKKVPLRLNSIPKSSYSSGFAATAETIAEK